MVSKGRQKTSRRYGTGVRKGQRVPQAIYSGKKRPPRVERPKKCKVCGRWFKTLQELNLHYTARSDHIRKRPEKKVTSIALKQFQDFTEEQRQFTLTLANILYDKQRFKKEMISLVRSRLNAGRR